MHNEDANEQATTEPEALDDIVREFPGWQPWLGVDHLFHARLRTGALIVVSAEDLSGLQEQIRLWNAQQATELARGLDGHLTEEGRNTLSELVLAGELDDVPWYIVR